MWSGEQIGVQISQIKNLLQATSLKQDSNAQPGNVVPVPRQPPPINYHSEAASYVEHMINYAQDKAKVILVKSKFEKLRKPRRGNRAKARRLNDAALALIRQSKDAEAIPFLEDAHKADPMDAVIANNLASAYFNTSFNNNDFSKAKAMLVDTLHLKPDRSIAWANLGRTFAMEGNEYAATNCYINFYRFSNNQKKALQHLAAGRSDPYPVLNKAFTNAYQYVSTVSTNSRITR